MERARDDLVMAVTVSRHGGSKKVQELQNLRAGDGVGTETLKAQGKSRPGSRRPMMRLSTGSKASRRRGFQVLSVWIDSEKGWGVV